MSKPRESLPDVIGAYDSRRPANVSVTLFRPHRREIECRRLQGCKERDPYRQSCTGNKTLGTPPVNPEVYWSELAIVIQEHPVVVRQPLHRKRQRHGDYEPLDNSFLFVEKEKSHKKQPTQVGAVFKQINKFNRCRLVHFTLSLPLF